MVTPILIGMSRFSPVRYLTVNVLAVVVWTVMTTGLGLVFGKAVAGMIEDLRQYESMLVGGLLAIGSGLAIHRWKHIGDSNRNDPAGD